ncbi:MAG TPA: PAS domain S-box protein [Gemmatimonadaceae bacterium]|nr:PAS domain S-box protein [Gemmatimonadaceae bacterium]
MAEHEERYRTLVELSPDAIAVHRDGRLVFSNAAGLRMLGAASLEEIVGRPLVQFVAPKYHDLVRARVREAAEQRVPQPPIDIEIVRLDGVTIDVHVATLPVVFEGAPALISFAHDVTDYNRARRDLERTISLQQATLESTTDGLLVVDTEGRMVSYNRKFTEMWRIPPAVLESGDDRSAIAYVLDQLRDPAQFLSKVQELYAQRDAKSFDVLEFKDGRTFERYSQPQRIGGRTIGRVWSFRDVTDRQRLAQRIARLEKMEAVARFASGVAHDFNNLLTIVRSYADLLMYQLGADESRMADLQQIKRATDRAASLARQLLLFSRRSPQAPRRLHVGAFLVELRPMLERLLRPGVSLSLDPGRDTLEVVVDPEQLERVVINLVVNANDAIAGTGSIAVHVETSQLDQQAAAVADVQMGKFAVIVVSDTGFGMTADTLAHVFEPFFTTKPPGQGTGLGLATVFGIVRQAGGQIDVESAPQRGTTFRILLPAAEPEGRPT